MSNPLNPEFWLSLGITPVVIDPDDSESVEQGLEQITQIIRNVADELEGEDE
ncbi:hypothetical protein [Calothrix sp. PCC 7507]|uniref:hypothetical protein n=1 Tax=Calothrix sp. PCC 7507 TaxID=99598 RepID=UPI00029F30E4|nr:hypothetical protein [Calothrix sp. PCC 7507]AFY31620.1 hypothetical protein Cal7507_1146 [Calothrix sp. PCC 7507]